jgi:AraC family transcriptional regulator
MPQLQGHGAALIDFASGAPSPLFDYTARLRIGDLTLARCRFVPNLGAVVGATQFTITFNVGEQFELEWRESNSDMMNTEVIEPGHVIVHMGDRPLFMRWKSSPSVTVIAIKQRFIHRTLVGLNLGPKFQLPPIFGVEDTVLQHLADLCESEIDQKGASGRLFTEGIATAMVVHLFRVYGNQTFLPLATGGLAPQALRQVMAYIEIHLKEDFGLNDLAAVVGFSTHHFAESFKRSVGLPPYRYVVGRRVDKAKELLLENRLTAAQIAAEVGFSSQSQLTVIFHKATGTTPARFRRESA